MMMNLNYTLCKTRANTPLVSIDTALGHGQEFDPSTLRKIAEALNKIADEAEQLPLGRQYQQTKKSIEISLL